MKKITPYSEFFWQLNNLDMDDKKRVKELATCYETWAEYENGDCEVEVLESLWFQKIVIVHDIFGETQIEDSWGFLDSVVKVLKLYVEEEKANDKFWRMANFWKRKLDLKNEDIFYSFADITDLKYEDTAEAINDLLKFCMAVEDHELWDRLHLLLRNEVKRIIAEDKESDKENVLNEFKYNNSIIQYIEKIEAKK